MLTVGCLGLAPHLRRQPLCCGLDEIGKRIRPAPLSDDVGDENK
jgi:hypothetical protein